LLSFNTSAQWSWINPLPQGNTLHDVQFISALTGFAVGDGGTILKTIDGGYTWNRMGNGSMVSLNSVFFLDTSIGWAISKEFEVLLKTTDGGITWTKAYNFDTFDMNDVWFTDPMHGVAVGYESVFITSSASRSPTSTIPASPEPTRGRRPRRRRQPPRRPGSTPCW
jgi:photosystem II stability/assembly factor-like uncharacterized protein